MWETLLWCCFFNITQFSQPFLCASLWHSFPETILNVQWFNSHSRSSRLKARVNKNYRGKSMGSPLADHPFKCCLLSPCLMARVTTAGLSAIPINYTGAQDCSQLLSDGFEAWHGSFDDRIGIVDSFNPYNMTWRYKWDYEWVSWK